MTYQIKKCVYIIKKRMYICVCVGWGVVLINILMLQLGPSKQKYLVPLLLIYIYFFCKLFIYNMTHNMIYKNKN